MVSLLFVCLFVKIENISQHHKDGDLMNKICFVRNKAGGTFEGPVLIETQKILS